MKKEQSGEIVQWHSGVSGFRRPAPCAFVPKFNSDWTDYSWTVQGTNQGQYNKTPYFVDKLEAALMFKFF